MITSKYAIVKEYTKKMSNIKADMNAYISIMEEIIKRTDVIRGLFNKEINMVYNDIQAETIALQIRMIIESIALASLSANKSLFEQEGDKFKEFWKADLIFRDIEKKNLNFYPQPVKEQPSKIPNVPEIIEIKTGFMTRSEIIKVHSKCCDILHAKNPYGRSRDRKTFLAQVPQWLTLIINLLNSHKIRLLNDSGFYLVHMRELYNESYRARMYYLGRDDNATKHYKKTLRRRQ